VSASLEAGPPATHTDLRAAQERERLLHSELPRVRAAATAWRNGLAGLLAALAGFSLIKGRSDVNQLALPWAAAVGVLLLAALIAAAIGALSLIRAANGRPSVVSVQELLPRGAADHIEALASASALRCGITLTLTSAALLVAAVATTWYGPARQQPTLEVTTPSGTACGYVVRLQPNRLSIKTSEGEVTFDISRTSAIRPVTICASP